MLTWRPIVLLTSSFCRDVALEKTSQQAPFPSCEAALGLPGLEMLIHSEPACACIIFQTLIIATCLKEIKKRAALLADNVGRAGSKVENRR